MKASIAICTWNRSEILDQTLQSLQRLNVPSGVEWEIAVVDNNSSDATPSVIERHGQVLPLIHLNEKRPGQSFARNLAMEATTGEIILWTDDDVLVDPNWMKATLDAFHTFDADLVYGRAEPWWESEPPTWFSKQFMGRFALLDHGASASVVKNRGQHGFGLNHSFRRSSLETIGGYRTDMGLRHNKGAGGEDLDIFNRAHDAGLRVVYTPNAVVKHFIPVARCRKSFSRSRAWRGSEDHLNLLRKNSDGIAMMFGIPRYLFRQQITVLTRYLKGLVTRNRSDTFFYELKLIQFAGLIFWSCRGRRTQETDRHCVPASDGKT